MNPTYCFFYRDIKHFVFINMQLCVLFAAIILWFVILCNRTSFGFHGVSAAIIL